MSEIKGIGQSEVEKKSLSFESVVDSMEIKSVESNHPTVEISDVGKKYFEPFREQVDSINKDNPGIFAVIRCWNKNEESFLTLCDEIDLIKESVPSLKGVIIAINNQGDKDNVTERSLETVVEKKGLSVPIIPLKINKYTWTSGLNSGISFVNEIAKNDNVDIDNIRMLNMSFDASMEKDQLVRMNELLKEQKYVLTIRNTSESEAPFGKDKDEIWGKFKKLLRNPMQSNLFELVYAMRNTFNVLPMSDLVSLGGYNPLCDGTERKVINNDGSAIENVSVKGMEDSEFFMRLILKSINESKHSVLKEIKKATESPIAYNDPSWQRIGEIDRFKKISNETDALVKITSGIVHTSIRETDMTIDRQSQDFKI